MKTPISTLPLLICFCCALKAVPGDKDKFHLEMEGMIKMAPVVGKEKREAMDSTTISIYDESKTKIHTYYTDKSGMCHFNLPLDSKFEVICARKRYVSKIIDVDTRVPKEKLRNFQFSFDISMFEEIREVEVPELKQAIAHISYDISIDCFAPYDEDRTDLINRDLSKRYHAYYKTHSGKTDSEEELENKAEDTMPAMAALKPEIAPELPKREPALVMEKKEQPVPEKEKSPCDEKKPNDIVYRIQIMALSKSTFSGNEVTKEYGPMYECVSNGLHRYMVGDFDNLSSAQSTLKEIVNKGFADAFPVAFINGERGTVGNVIVYFRK
jgi:hypothetical protein